MNEKEPAALILAAGRSSRMGAFKPLLPLGGRTVIETIINLYQSAGISDILVVLGHRAADVRTVLERQGIGWVMNDEYDQGMFSSIQAGVQSLSPDCGAFFLHPADIPFIRPETLSRLIGARRIKKAGIYHPCFEGRRGHPPLIAAALIPAILAFDEPGGMRMLLSRYTKDALNVECHDAGILADLNTPEDYARMACKPPDGKNL